MTNDGRMTANRRIAVLSAGLSTPSSTRLLADRLAAATVAVLADRGIAAQVEHVEVREHAQAVVSATLTRFPGPDLEGAIQTVTGADALIAVTPTFNASYSGLFKSFVDLLEPGALDDVPVLIGATGGSERHSLVLDHALRPLFAYLHAVVLPTGVYAASADWGSGDAAGAGALPGRIERAGRELGDLVAVRPSRPVLEDALAVDADFEDLLRSLD
ncbi:MAG TPA: CE1759 family FMN reductase [Amnibacterium sp.]|nr:CE1759 family FMN reductase [Amnibacterium sp.]